MRICKQTQHGDGYEPCKGDVGCVLHDKSNGMWIIVGESLMT